MKIRMGVLAAVALVLSACGGGGGGANGGSGAPLPGTQAAVGIAIVPGDVTVTPGGAQGFTCAVNGTDNTQCTWKVQEGSAGGNISAGGNYTAPAADGTFHVIATAVADPARTATATVRVSATATRQPWVTGYYAGWYWPSSSPADVDMSAMTHFVFGRVAPGSGTLHGNPGDVMPGAGSAHRAGEQGAPDPARSVEDYLVRRAHAAGTRALLMVGGAGDGAGFLRSTADGVRPTFVRNLVDYAIAHDYDGIDMDWEDELGANSLGLPAAETYRRLLALMRDLRIEANTRARYQSPNAPFILTFPGYAKNLNINQVQPWEVEVASLSDQFNLMSYGIGTASDAQGWHSWFTSPISGKYGNAPVDLASSIDAFVAKGVPRGKLGIGMGFYGIYYGNPAEMDPTAPPLVTGPRQELRGARLEADDNALAYNVLVELGYLDHGTYAYDTEAQAAYRTYTGPAYPRGFRPAIAPHDGRSAAGFLSYENGQSIAAKGAWVRNPQTAVGGAIVWTINYGYLQGNGPHGSGGSNPLLAAVKCSFLQRGCPAPATP
ncbi:glycoside hydrolase family 18 protein [Ramlibacter pallidus]|uniref:chitinase n=1 Tax=Ramlibacter pallidus TaxID=2780087 RepID=A0ABR9S609_9BURK|nr:glycoside hydrolase family 18 protein [Ramlibacter pallidus]MBE7368447.1 glycoside hydrolase family 18 protein [Ramlibacter pallidus]